jgi:Tfp pilus assembly protein PilX
MKILDSIKTQFNNIMAKLTEQKETEVECCEQPCVQGLGSTLLNCEMTETDEGIVLETTKAVEISLGCLITSTVEVYVGKKPSVGCSTVFIPNATIVEDGEKNGIKCYNIVDKNSIKPVKKKK